MAERIAFTVSSASRQPSGVVRVSRRSRNTAVDEVQRTKVSLYVFPVCSIARVGIVRHHRRRFHRHRYLCRHRRRGIASSGARHEESATHETRLVAIAGSPFAKRPRAAASKSRDFLQRSFRIFSYRSVRLCVRACVCASVVAKREREKDREREGGEKRGNKFTRRIDRAVHRATTDDDDDDDGSEDEDDEEEEEVDFLTTGRRARFLG